MVAKKGRAGKQIAPAIEPSTSGTTIIRGTSTRPLISFASDQPAVILEDIAEPAQPLPAHPPDRSLTPESEEKHETTMQDDRIYCVCKRLYDGRTMIACDRCDNWFHNDCVGIGEDAVELVDIFICPTCQTGTEKVTTWKTKCARPGCHLASRTLSKYCSEWCGVECAASRLDQASIGCLQFWESVRGVKKPDGIVITERHETHDSTAFAPGNLAADNAVLQQLRFRLDEVINKKLKIERQAQLTTSRLKYLSYAISRWENMCLETARALQTQDTPGEDLSTNATPVAAKSKKSNSRAKGKGKGTAKKSGTNHRGSVMSSSEAPCGFDVRLIWDDKDWAQWSSSEQFTALFSNAIGTATPEPTQVMGKTEDCAVGPMLDHGIEEGVICLIMKKRCDRHLGWQKTRESDFQTELNTLNMRLDKLATEERQLREEIENQEQLAKFTLAKSTSPKKFPELPVTCNNSKRKLTSSKKKKKRPPKKDELLVDRN